MRRIFLILIVILLLAGCSQPEKKQFLKNNYSEEPTSENPLTAPSTVTVYDGATFKVAFMNQENITLNERPELRDCKKDGVSTTFNFISFYVKLKPSQGIGWITSVQKESQEYGVYTCTIQIVDDQGVPRSEQKQISIHVVNGER